MESLKIKLFKAQPNDLAVMQNLARFYVYDMSRYCGFLPGWKCPETGLYECYDLKKYFINESHYPFLIRVNGELAGFVLVNKISITPNMDWHMDEFFIMAKFQRHGVGQKVARHLWSKFPGTWELLVIPQNERGLNFWRKTIQDFTKNQYTEAVKSVAWDKINPRVFFNFSAPEIGKQ
ncbi:GNAT family N-acetyltransferase [Legionella brunensis]|uniref:GNAT family acetyltransferase n=1 Tax=Legionella brunensis TaxID=29422 RepID=A0A0W0S3W9_9GAMM|nr:GNAT family N-acetyltransferase [Legionella brunensis]KTC78182.1 GNAT family acetyltransferase [Legionella brunensis]